jgi:hypothetical protein
MFMSSAHNSYNANNSIWEDQAPLTGIGLFQKTSISGWFYCKALREQPIDIQTMHSSMWVNTQETFIEETIWTMKQS